MKTLITSMLLFLTMTIYAQETYIKVNKGADVIYYPPGTKFDLKNPHGYIILKYSQTPRVEEIDGYYEMVLNPNSKKKDIIKLQKGDKVALILTENFEGVQSTYKKSHINSDDLKGTWKIDLRPTPTSEAYYQLFEVNSIEKNTFKGTFYGSSIKEGLINTQWKSTYFAFSTSDKSNTYYHSGYILDGKIYGISYCPNRNFTAPWKGEKKKN